MNLYDKDRDVIALGQFYTDHISAMTREGLHAKSDIAAELAYRDQRIATLEAEKAEYEREKLKREAQEPVAFRWLGPGKGWRAVYAEPPVSRELEARIRELEAEKAERERQEPVAWVLFDDIFIAPKDMQDDPPNLECMKPLYAHPLALREPTEDECRRIANEFLILGGPDELAGRVMFNAVREVMTK